MVGYIVLAMQEDRATQACDPSAGMVPYGTGGFPQENRLLSNPAGAPMR